MIRTILICMALATPAMAEGFDRVSEREAFVGLIAGKSLKRFGVTLEVSPGGGITGSAFGQPVTGAWRWRDGLFCRDLFFGARDLGPNCQVVALKGSTLRFIADEGAGDHADLRIE
ncbi:dihydrodipicolinate reductase [Cereibacter changlensis JA139]|uniref:Dihydrodipicolinate reductase n=2 Tax=Cereibacter changlensis TaxID=402884 RepID=A0A2T4K0E1_9RHOB|nr:dihydrodipicolinate reductase [Cereibacter changlensis]PTE23547.1 dihydrodipicolinate reductase [Cereibacter changlensis JA139]PZX58536.1 hypothetical protein LX76_00036 [Cereibacter changlensis]